MAKRAIMFYLETLPNTCDQLELLLCDESWCEKYFISRRRLSGLSCSRCNGQITNPPIRDPIICPDCGARFSLTSGTLLHGTKKNISQWLKAVWLLCHSLNHVSIRKFQEKLQIENYQTARKLMQKLHWLIRRENDKECSGSVEVGDCTLFTKKENKACHLFAVVEIDTKHNMCGRLRLFPCNTESRECFDRILERCVQKGSIVLCPDRHPYHSVRSDRHLIITEQADLNVGAAHKLLAMFIAFHLHGSSSVFSLNRLETLCDEFCFQENKKLFPDTLALFDNLVTGMVTNQTPQPESSRSGLRRDGGTQ